MVNAEKGESLLARGVDAAVWSGVGAAVRIGLQVIAQVVLARILGPESYGEFAVALALILFASVFSDFGLSYGLIHRSEISEDDVRFVLTWQLILAILLTSTLWLSAGWIAAWFANGRLEAIVKVLSLSIIIAACGSTGGMLLRRRLDFRSINLIAAGSYAVGFLVVGLGMALFGYGVWSLVAANLSQLAIAATLHIVVTRHSMRPLLRHTEWRGMFGFGGTVLLTSLLNWIMSGLDRLIVGMTMPMAAAGLYATISNLMISPVATVNGVLQSALYATSARAQNEQERLQRALTSVLAAVLLFLTPAFVAIGMVPATFSESVLGPKWFGGDVVLRPLAFAVPAILLMGMAVPTLWAAGRTTWEFKIQLPMAFLWMLALIFVAKQGSLALLAWFVCFWFYLRAAAIVYAACLSVRMPVRQLLNNLQAGLIVNVAVAATALMLDVVPIGLAIVRLILIVIGCSLVLLLSIYLVRGLMSDGVMQLLHRLLDWIPSAAARDGIRRRLLASPL